MSKLYIHNGPMEGLAFELKGDISFIGRGSDNEIQIRDKTISRKHAKIIRKDNQFFIEDLSSQNGTWIDGRLMKPGGIVEIEERTSIAVGNILLRLGTPSSEDGTITQYSIDVLAQEAKSSKGLQSKDKRVTTLGQLELIRDASLTLMQSLKIDDICNKVMESLFCHLKRIDSGVILLIDPETQDLKQIIARSRVKKGRDRRMNYSRTIVNQVVSEGKAVMMLDTNCEDKIVLSDSAKELGIKSLMCVPLISKAGTRGAIYVHSANAPNGFRKEDLLLLTGLSSPVALAMENALLYSERKKAERALQRNCEELEMRVEERTAEISNTNAFLTREINERELAEERLRETNKFLSNVLDSSLSISIISTDLKQNILFWNKGAENIFGYTSAEVVGRQKVDILYPGGDSKSAADEARSLVLKNRKGINRQIKEVTKDKRELWINLNLTPRLDKEGHVVGILGVGEDITERKFAEEKLKHEKKRLESLIEHSCLAIVTLDDKRRIISCNRNFEELFQLEQAEVCGKNLDETIAGEALVKDAFSYTEKTFQGESIQGTAKRYRKDGTPLEVEFFGVPVIVDGKILGAFGIYRDISDRKRAEEALQKEKEKFRALVEESPFGVSVIGSDGQNKYLNSRFIEMFGYSLEDIPTGEKWFEKAYSEPIGRKQAVSVWVGDILESKIGESRPRTFSMRCKDGSVKTIKLRPVTMQSGDRFIMYEDISEQKHLERQLQQAQKMEAIGSLAGGIAHDFNNLLATIIGNADLSLRKLPGGRPVLGNIEQILKAGNSAASLTRQLLAFSRRQTIQPRVLDLNELLDGTQKMVSRLIGEDVQLKAILPACLWPVKADPGQVEQVIINLAVNARDAMPMGGKLTLETANVELKEAYFSERGAKGEPGSYVMLAVSDTGFGMNREILSRIFEPFFTTKEKGRGTGLGLSTVYGIVKQAGGFVWAYSEPGKGTTFKVYFPRSQEEVARGNGRPKLRESLRGSETILIVEDDEQVLEMATSVLEESGYSVLRAKSAAEARRLNEEQRGPIHLMVTDVVMHETDGPQLALHLRPLRPKMKVLYMSGYTGGALAHRGVLQPGIAFLQKPFSPHDLLQKVREMLER